MRPTEIVTYVFFLCASMGVGFVFGGIVNQARMRRHFRAMAEEEVRYVHHCWEKWIIACYPHAPPPPPLTPGPPMPPVPPRGRRYAGDCNDG